MQRKSISRKRLAMLGALAVVLGVSVPVAYSVLNVGSVSLSITFVDPPLSPASGAIDGSACSVSGTTVSCTGLFTIGATNTVVIGLANRANVPQSITTSTTAPSACAFSTTEGSATIPAYSSGSVTVSISVGPSVTPGTQCTASIALNQT